MRGSIRRIFLFTLVSILLSLGVVSAEQVDVIHVLSSIPPNSGQAAYWYEVGRMYERFNPGVKIRWDFSATWGDYIQKLNVSLAARQGPDIAWGNTDYLNVPGRGLENQADVIPVPDEYFPPEEQRWISEAVLMQTVYPGKGRTIWPWSIYVGEIGTFLVNADYLQGVGYDPAEIRQNGWTTDEYVDAMTKIREKYGAYAFYLLPADGEYASSVVYNSKIRPLYQMGIEGMYGNPIFDLTTGEIIVDETLLARSWGWVAKLIDMGLVLPESRSFQAGDKQNAFFTGKIATWWNGPDRLALIERYNQDVAAGRIEGKPVRAAVLPVPYVDEPGFGPSPIMLLTYGYYNFKQTPYKGDEHTRHVQEFTDFITSVTFQPYLAAQSFPTVDTRLYSGEYAMLPALYDLDDPNISYWLNVMVKAAVPNMNHTWGIAITPEAQNVYRTWRSEVYLPNLEAVFLGRKSPEQAAHDAVSELRRRVEGMTILTDRADDVKALIEEFGDKREAKLKQEGLWDMPSLWKGLGR